MRIHNTIDRLDDQIFRTQNGDCLTISQLKDLMYKSFRYSNRLQPDQAEKESTEIITLYLKHLGLEVTDENMDKVWNEVIGDLLWDYTGFLSEVDYRSGPLAQRAIEACELFEVIGYGRK